MTMSRCLVLQSKQTGGAQTANFRLFQRWTVIVRGPVYIDGLARHLRFQDTYVADVAMCKRPSIVSVRSTMKKCAVIGPTCYIYIYIYPPTPADGGGARQRTLPHPAACNGSEDTT